MGLSSHGVAAFAGEKGRSRMSNESTVQSVESLGNRVGPVAATHIDHAFRAILRGEAVTKDPRFSRLITGEPHPFGNFVLLSSGADAAAARGAVKPLLAGGAPSAVLIVEEPSEELLKELTACGFTRHPGMPAMAVDISKLGGARLPDGYSFSEVGPDERAAWAEAFARGYELPMRVGEEFAAGMGEPPMTYYAIRRAGVMVCTSAVFRHGGVVGVYAVATVPEARRQGLGAFATAEPLRRAGQSGFRVGVLQSSEAGHPVYLGLGFRDYGEVALFVR